MSENAVATVEPRQVVVGTDSGQVLEMISRVASDPNADIDKLERLMALHERMEAAQAEKAFNAAMTAAQSEMGRVSADAENKQTHSKYATYGKLDKALRPIYTAHGFALSFDEGDSPKGPEWVRVLCYVSHSAGFSKTYHKDMPADGKGAKGGDVMTKTHASGAAMSYGMRYLLKGIFNVAIGEEDNDGNGPKGMPISEKQAADIEALITEVGADKAKFLEWAQVSKVEDIPSKNYAVCVKMLRRKAK